MVDQLISFVLRGMDILLGWLLRLPPDVQLFAVAIASALILTSVRLWTSNQDLLRRCSADKARLKVLLRKARAGHDQEAVKRYRGTVRMIGMKQLRQEGRPLLASLAPIAVLATWALHRLEFHPLKEGERVELCSYFPESAVGRLVHLVPGDQIEVVDGWIREIARAPGEGEAHGIATWRVSGEAGVSPKLLQVRFGEATVEHPVRFGSRIYEQPIKNHDGPVLATEVKMRPVKLFGVIPGVPALHLAPWLVGYLLIVIPIVFALKRFLRVF